jgi:hypothetical protein
MPSRLKIEDCDFNAKVEADEDMKAVIGEMDRQP